MSETLRRVQALAFSGEVEVSRHGFRELAADGILLGDAVDGLAAAIALEDYPAFEKEPSVLALQPMAPDMSSTLFGVFRKAQRRPRCW